jgi:hypothetical protein
MRGASPWARLVLLEQLVVRADGVAGPPHAVVQLRLQLRARDGPVLAAALQRGQRLRERAQPEVAVRLHAQQRS